MPFRFSRISVLFVPLATPTTSFDMTWFVYLLKRASLPDIFLRRFSALQLDKAAEALLPKTYSYPNAEEMINMLKIESGKEVEYKRG
ncbi:MAG: hypothetical protein Q8O47_08990 [Candidatus Bathyarchaeota archaeon]|nr:hypothetical protein [Candidatus Bathyarchaeota archaeon]